MQQCRSLDVARNYLYDLCSYTSHTVNFLLLLLFSCQLKTNLNFFHPNFHIVLTKRVLKGLSFYLLVTLSFLLFL